MEIDQAAHAHWEHWEHAGEQDGDANHWSYIDALGKGKGGKGKGGYGKATGKGFPRQCYTCGETGHLSYECPKGKGKGKGKTLICWNCGNAGHPHWLCPDSKGKGKGTSWGKGHAKGTYAVDSDWQAWGNDSGEHMREQDMGEPSTGLGGGEINEVDTWQVKVSRARGKRDMRPQATQTGNRRPTGVKTSNRFGNLEEEGEEERDDENEEPREPRWRMSTENRWTKVRRENGVMSVDVNRPQEIGAVTQVEGQWERIPVKIDSGAIDTVMPPMTARYFDTVQTEMSKKGPGFRAANGSAIKHYGQKTLEGIGDQYQPLSMTAQVAEVKTTLGSVNQMLKAGNRVHFETGNCYIQDVRTGKKTKVEEKGGTFEVGIWVPMQSSGRRCDQVAKPVGNPRASFQRQDEEF